VAAASVAGHVVVGLALVFLDPAGPTPPPSPPMDVTFVELALPPPPAPAPPTPARSPVKSAASRARPTPVRASAPHIAARVVTNPTGPTLAARPSSGLDIADLANASDADAGPPAGDCDMARRLQGALRRDPLVRTAVLASTGKAILVWNGDWVQSGGEDGKGLAAVREAIMWEIGFAPPACRAQSVHGIVLLSMNAAPGSVRLAVGARDWRWSDLLGRR
jgi:hypothetical protein